MYIDLFQNGVQQKIKTKIKSVLVYQIIESIRNYPVYKMCDIANVSKSGCFFGHMKSEINLKKVKTFEKVIEIINEYMYDYNNNRKQWNKNRMTPIEYRQFLVK